RRARRARREPRRPPRARGARRAPADPGELLTRGVGSGRRADPGADGRRRRGGVLPVAARGRRPAADERRPRDAASAGARDVRERVAPAVRGAREEAWRTVMQPPDHTGTGVDDPRFGALWAAHRRRMLDLAFRMLLDVRDAEDVVQESFARLTRTDIEHLDDPEAWLVVVTGRLCL